MIVRKLIFLLYFLPLIAFGQYHITGKVVNIIDKKPVGNASVFLSNASAGSKTNDDGTFDITNVRSGHYEMVVSIVGYETYRQNVVVNNDLAIAVIQIEQKSIELKQVNIGPDANWDRNYDMFKKEFLGSGRNADNCKILNPGVLNLEYSAVKRELTANSTDFIEIENKALAIK